MKQKPNPHGEDSAELDKEVDGLPVLRSNVAGVDLGSTTHWVCAPTVDGAAREVVRGSRQCDTGREIRLASTGWRPEYAGKAVERLVDADFQKPVKALGPDANMGDVVYLITAHTHEHLGQSIAYARENGVTPPWTKNAGNGAQE